MSECFPLTPRYRLDDEQVWLVGIDPLRRYWLLVNGDAATSVALSGLNTNNFEVFREAIVAFRNMSAGDYLQLPTAGETLLTVRRVSENCFVIQGDVNGSPVSHVFDQETLESLLMTAHPDWRCAPQHEELGRRLLFLSWEKSEAVQAA